MDHTVNSKGHDDDDDDTIDTDMYNTAACNDFMNNFKENDDDTIDTDMHNTTTCNDSLVNPKRKDGDIIGILTQSYVREKESMSVISKIEDDFFVRLHTQIKLLDGRRLQQVCDVLHEFRRMRHSKILQFASVMGPDPSIEIRLSREEKVCYRTVCDAFRTLSEQTEYKVFNING